MENIDKVYEDAVKALGALDTKLSYVTEFNSPDGGKVTLMRSGHQMIMNDVATVNSALSLLKVAAEGAAEDVAKLKEELEKLKAQLAEVPATTGNGDADSQEKNRG